jgi:hypothetical protein
MLMQLTMKFALQLLVLISCTNVMKPSLSEASGFMWSDGEEKKLTVA